MEALKYKLLSSEGTHNTGANISKGKIQVALTLAAKSEKCPVLGFSARISKTLAMLQSRFVYCVFQASFSAHETQNTLQPCVSGPGMADTIENRFPDCLYLDLGSKTSAEASFAQEQTTGTTDKFQVAACQITQEAQALIDRITGAETQDFSELARIAGLDPRKDFVGADLSGIDLSGLDLSDADLSGANLSHTNLSSANLSHANLSGTNLSNANLTAADLSGADLSCANLSGANLSQTKLKDACLNQSTGLSEESKSFLQNGGASIETSDKPTKTPGERYPRGKYIAAR